MVVTAERVSQIDAPRINGFLRTSLGSSQQNAEWEVSKEKVLTPNPEWVIRMDAYDPLKQEVINSLANGYMGVRSSVASNEGHSPATYIAGLYEMPAESLREAPVPNLVNIPNFLHIEVNNGHEVLDVDEAHKAGRLAYETELDMKSGVVTERMRWVDTEGRITLIQQRQLLSHGNRHIAAMQFEITPENYESAITVRTGIDGTVDNNGNKYLEEEAKGAIDDNGIYYRAKTMGKDEHVLVASAVYPVGSIIVGDESIFQELVIDSQKGKAVSFDKIISVHSSRDIDLESAIDPAQEIHGTSFQKLAEANRNAWAEIWRESDILIEGDPKMQQAVRYAVFKLKQLAPHDERISIAAKGLDNKPDEGYKGHIFWDTEIFMLPFFIDTDPAGARQLLMYRYNTLDSAREKAQQYGYRGALYPWESTDDGHEATPRWVRGADGEIIHIYTGEREFHISADIAYSVWEYVKATGDMEFLRDFGGEIIAETARFWSSKAEYNAAEDRYEINGVIGPDEYHEKGPDGEIGVDNNAYNNVMAQWNIRKALAVLQMAPQVKEKIAISDEEITQWETVASKIYIPFDPETRVYSQFDGFYNLEHVNLDDPQYRGITSMDATLKAEGKNPSQYQTIKQADVLLGLYLLGEQDPEIIRANYEFYARRTSHGSSLSDAIHAIMAVRSGHTEKALEHLANSAYVDLDDTKANNHIGSHVAAMGGTLQAITHGFGGVQQLDDRLVIDPVLPDHWEGLEFNIQYRGQKVVARVEQDTLYLALPYSGSSETIPVRIKGEEYDLVPEMIYKLSSQDESIDTNPGPNGRTVFDGGGTIAHAGTVAVSA